MIGVRDRAVDLGYAAGWNLVKAAPAGLANRAFRAAADAAAVRNGGSARQLRANLRRVLGPAASEKELDQVVGDGLRSYARYWLEAFRLPRMDHHAIADYVDAHETGAHHMFDALDVAGRGLIITLPHLGNWDAVGAWFVVRRGPFTTVVERLRPESLFDRFVAYRQSLGFEIVPLTGGDQSPMGVLTERLRANGTVCLVADRDLSSSGIEVEFFGEPARMPPGPALLAVTTGAALVPAAPYFTADGWGLTVDPPIEPAGQRLRDQVRDGTQRLADVFAQRIAEHPADWHMLQPFWSADVAAAAGRGELMRIGIVCPYSWDIPGGVQSHVRDLAETLTALGHVVSVLAPGDEDMPGLPPYVVTAGKAVPIPYNGSVARLQFGVVSAARVRRWLRDGEFDVVHVHEPAPPSLSLLTCMIHDGPLVATFHVATARSRFLSMFDTVLQPFMEKLSGRIAVSAAARKVIVEHLGADAVVIPNGVDVARFATAQPLPGYPRTGGTIGFVGRFDETRKGMHVLIDSLAQLVGQRPELRLLVAGRGDRDEFRDRLPSDLAAHVQLLGQVSDPDKASLLRSVDVYCAPNTGQESFGVILLEAMAAGAPIVASDLEAFRRVLAGGAAGELFRAGDGAALAIALGRLLDDPDHRAALAAAGRAAVAPFDWTRIAREVLRVYELAIAGAGVLPN